MQKQKSFDFFRIFNKPEIGKRLRYMGYQFALFFQFFTSVFVRSGLIDKNHPCANPANFGRYEFREILGLAFSNLQWNRAGVPQIMVFFSVVLALVFMALSVGVTVLMVALKINSANAQTPPAIDENVTIFTNPVVDSSRDTDLVYIFLSNVFGDTGLSYFTGTPATPNWMHQMLTSMLSLYSIAMMVVATIIIMYYVATALLETSAEGVPFGQRFNLVWAPIRFVMALAFLAPISNGYNVAQLIVFQAADWGSGMASHVWAKGLQAFGEQDVIGPAEADKGVAFIRGFFLASTCMEAWNQYVYQQSGTPDEYMRVTTSLDKSTNHATSQTVKSIIYRFGNMQSSDYCGMFKVPIVEGVNIVSGMAKNQGGRIIQATYQDILHELSGGMATYNPLDNYGWGLPGNGVGKNCATTGDACLGDGDEDTGNLNDALVGSFLASLGPLDLYSRPVPVGGDLMQGVVNGDSYWPTSLSVPVAAHMFVRFYNPESSLYSDNEDEIYDVPYFSTDPSIQVHWMNTIYQNGIMAGAQSAKRVQEEIAKEMVRQGASLGWGQAGAYFMTIAQMNNSIQDAFQNKLQIMKLPELLTDKDARPTSKGWLGKLFSAVISFWKMITFQTDNTSAAAEFTYPILVKAEKWWDNSPQIMNEQNELETSGMYSLESTSNTTAQDSSYGADAEGMLDKVSSGGKGLIASMVTFMTSSVNTYNPFASLATLGGWLQNGALILMTVGFALTFMSFLTGLGMFFMAIAGSMLAAGMMLSIMLPIIPYFYFTFAVINWVIGIFEAVVAMPLWALSFLKIDGDSLLPDESMNAFFIIFQIFLRPTMIIIALIGSMLVFSAGVIFLNLTFGSMMTQMLSSGGILMPIFMVAAYIYMVYSIAMAVFKMVDTIPNMIIDYLGVGGITPMTDYDDPSRTQRGLMAVAGYMGADAMVSGMSGAAEERIDRMRAARTQAKADEEQYKRGQEDLLRRIRNRFGNDRADDIISSLNNKNISRDRDTFDGGGGI